MPLVVPPGVVVVVDVELCDMHTRVQELKSLVSHLNAQLYSGSPLTSAHRRVAAVVSAEEERALVIVTGSIFRMDIEGTHELWNVFRSRAEKYAADVDRKTRPMDHFLMHDTPPTLLALASSLRHQIVSGGAPEQYFATDEDAMRGTKAASVGAPCTVAAVDVVIPAARGGAGGGRGGRAMMVGHNGNGDDKSIGSGRSPAPAKRRLDRRNGMRLRGKWTRTGKRRSEVLHAGAKPCRGW